MSLISKAFSPHVKDSPLPYTGSSFMGAQGLPPKANMETFLRAYGESVWFHAGVSRIAESVADTSWYLQRLKKNGDYDPVENHPLQALLNKPNPWMTGRDLFELTTIYLLCAAEAYWIKEPGPKPSELWIAEPQFMRPVIDDKKFISGYVYSRGGKNVPFPPENVVRFVLPDPKEPWRGTGPAQAAQIDIESDSFAKQYNRNYFYRGADPGTVVSYPADQNVTPEEYEKLKEQWNANHRGYGRAHSLAILTGGAKLEQTGHTFRDMAFPLLLKGNREAILGSM